MTDQEKAAEVMEYLMRECKPHMEAIHKVFCGQAELTLVARVPDQPGAFLLSAAGIQITPAMLIKSLQELEAMEQQVSAYGGTFK